MRIGERWTRPNLFETRTANGNRVCRQAWQTKKGILGFCLFNLVFYSVIRNFVDKIGMESAGLSLVPDEGQEESPGNAERSAS